MAGELTFAKLRGNVRVIEDGIERVVLLLQGDPLPANLAPGQLEKLQKYGAVGRRAVVSVFRTVEEAATETTPAPPGPATNLGTLGQLADDALVKLITDEKPGVAKLLAAVGSDVALAQRLLAAEKTATKDDPRSTLVKGLEKVIAGGAG